MDGPLLSAKSHWYPENRVPGKKVTPKFDEFSVRAFNLWAKYSGAKIVFSTNWSWHWTKDELKHIMKMNGLGFDYHDEVLTPKRMTPSRHDEILNWLEAHSSAGDTFIAVDDDTYCEQITKQLDPDSEHNRCDTIDARGQWIKVDYENGISMENFIEGCWALGIDTADILEKEFGVKKKTPEEIEATLRTWI